MSIPVPFLPRAAAGDFRQPGVKAGSGVISGVLLLLLVGTSQLPAQGPTAYTVSESASPCLNLRPQPDADAESVDCLPPDTEVLALEAAPYWRKVRLADGRTGWAAKKFLEPLDTAAIRPGPSPIPPDAWLQIHVVDVGQGDGVWIHTHDDGIAGNEVFEGTNIILDGGPDAADDRNQILAYLREHAHQDAVIDALIVTHPHNDHFNGAEGLLRHFEVRNIYDPGYPKGGKSYPAFLREARAETVGERPARVMVGRQSFDTPAWGRELTVEILHSYPGHSVGLGAGNTLENNASIVLRLVYGSHSFLFMGDAEGKDRGDAADRPRYVEKILLETVPPDRLKSTVLKLGHHGSETSSTLPFLRAVDPEIVLVSSGRKRFGGTFIPDSSTLARYCAHNPRVRILRTDQDDEAEGRDTRTDADGDHVVLRSNGTVLQVEARSGGRAMVPGGC